MQIQNKKWDNDLQHNSQNWKLMRYFSKCRILNFSNFSKFIRWIVSDFDWETSKVFKFLELEILPLKT